MVEAANQSMKLNLVLLDQSNLSEKEKLKAAQARVDLMENECIDKVSAVGGVIYGSSLALSSVLGGFLSDSFGFRSCCDIMVVGPAMALALMLLIKVFSPSQEEMLSAIESSAE